MLFYRLSEPVNTPFYYFQWRKFNFFDLKPDVDRGIIQSTIPVRYCPFFRHLINELTQLSFRTTPRSPLLRMAMARS